MPHILETTSGANLCIPVPYNFPGTDRKLCEMIEHVAFKGEHRLSRLSLLCDHVHLVIGGKIDQSPEGIALGFLNSGAIALGMKPQFKFGYYAGTTGEYDLGAV